MSKWAAIDLTVIGSFVGEVGCDCQLSSSQNYIAININACMCVRVKLSTTLELLLRKWLIKFVLKSAEVSNSQTNRIVSPL